MEREKNILLVEDDASLGFLMKDALEEQYQVCWVADGNKAESTLADQKFDLCLLDVMLPHKSGFELAEIIRRTNEDMPILFVSARALEEDRLKGFKSGGDDYIVKPFSMDELKHRIAVFLKRSQKITEKETMISLGHYNFDRELLTLTHGENSRKLTRKESSLLSYLAGKQNEVIKREEILRAVWGKDDYFTGRSLDVFISKLRKYLSEDPQLAIENYHGIGFLFKVRA